MIDSSNFAFPKPGEKEGLVKLSPAKYRKHKEVVWERQGRRCRKCKAYLPDPKTAHLHHTDGRGMGGGKRDDRKTVLLCEGCHVKEHEG
jgi:hypothetical protein